TLIENVFTNRVGAGSDTDDEADGGVGLTVSVGSRTDGFYVADDGRGFEVDPEAATEYGCSSTPDGTGFGLAIVREIAAAHGWDLSIDGGDGADGARFEFRGVVCERVEPSRSL
ncbi:ATP-binding protein, partial [Halorubrum sp. SD612]|uniref:sensor histidine kinase n=1 Tax=Halorubrum sp. SD612 TaxID=1855863 RepID=UPI0031B64483